LQRLKNCAGWQFWNIINIERPSIIAPQLLLAEMFHEKGENKMVAKKPDLERSLSGDKIEPVFTSDGRVAELRKEFSVWSLGSLCLCLMVRMSHGSRVIAALLQLPQGRNEAGFPFS
jgi:hypothetical protein